jgi:hypothetical protein
MSNVSIRAVVDATTPRSQNELERIPSAATRIREEPRLTESPVDAPRRSLDLSVMDHDPVMRSVLCHMGPDRQTESLRQAASALFLKATNPPSIVHRSLDPMAALLKSGERRYSLDFDDMDPSMGMTEDRLDHFLR